eukprot:13496743-Ditylum_brightwellii.AAC.1
MTSNLVQGTNRLSFGEDLDNSNSIEFSKDHSMTGESSMEAEILSSDENEGHLMNKRAMHGVVGRVANGRDDVTEELEGDLEELLAAKENDFSCLDSTVSSEGDANCILAIDSTPSTQESELPKTRLIRRFSLASPGRVSLSTKGNRILEKVVDSPVDPTPAEEHTEESNESARGAIPSTEAVDLTWKELSDAAGL